MTDFSRDPGAHRPAHHVPWPVRGQILTFLRNGSTTVPEFARAVATGDVIVDPDTGSRWLPVIQPDLEPALLDVATVIDFDAKQQPRRPGGDQPEGQGS